MKLEVTYKKIPLEEQKLKTENICKIIAGALERNVFKDNDDCFVEEQYIDKEEHSKNTNRA